MSAFCLSSVISSSAGSLSAQLLSALIASVADESGDAENKKENRLPQSPHRWRPFSPCRKERIYPALPSVYLSARLQHSVQSNQRSAFCHYRKAAMCRGSPFFDCALYTFGNIRLYGNGRGIRSLRQGVIHILAWCNRHLA